MNLLIDTDVPCPWCGETYGTTIDTSQGDQDAIEDCTVCCRPIRLSIQCDPGELVALEAERG
ncbi:MAG TPA: CPXCG motif-containing cysteine-rich protein [Chthoniobacteraceae bacterium]